MCHVQSLEKDFYLDTPSSFHHVCTLLESTTLSKLSYMKNKTKKKLQNLQKHQNNDENKIKLKPETRNSIRTSCVFSNCPP